jgi:hypothetical protein
MYVWSNGGGAWHFKARKISSRFMLEDYKCVKDVTCCASINERLRIGPAGVSHFMSGSRASWCCSRRSTTLSPDACGPRRLDHKKVVEHNCGLQLAIHPVDGSLYRQLSNLEEACTQVRAQRLCSLGVIAFAGCTEVFSRAHSDNRG